MPTVCENAYWLACQHIIILKKLKNMAVQVFEQKVLAASGYKSFEFRMTRMH